jgi:ribulose-phosphate 3-epimerase
VGALPIISASLLSADLLHLETDLRKTEASGADWHHVDVMDGHFVPTLSFGLPIIRQLKSISKLPLDVHLMVSNPDAVIEGYLDAGADILTFHLEATAHPHRLIQQIHARGAKAGISLNPGTDVRALIPLLGELDLVLLMTVNPGFGGQSFLPFCLSKIRDLSALLHQQGHANSYLSVDGGINDATAPLVRQAGATVLVAGSFLYGAADRSAAVSMLQSERV